MVNTLQPAVLSWVMFDASRATFAANFAFQNSDLVDGIVANLQPPCRCQKQP